MHSLIHQKRYETMLGLKSVFGHATHWMLGRWAPSFNCTESKADHRVIVNYPVCFLFVFILLIFAFQIKAIPPAFFLMNNWCNKRFLMLVLFLVLRRRARNSEFVQLTLQIGARVVIADERRRNSEQSKTDVIWILKWMQSAQHLRSCVLTNQFEIIYRDWIRSSYIGISFLLAWADHFRVPFSKLQVAVVQERVTLQLLE